MAAAGRLVEDGGEPVLAERRRGWRSSPVSSAQLMYLLRLGIKPPDGCTKGQAAQLIGQALCSYAVERARVAQERATWQSA